MIRHIGFDDVLGLKGQCKLFHNLTIKFFVAPKARHGLPVKGRGDSRGSYTLDRQDGIALRLHIKN